MKSENFKFKKSDDIINDMGIGPVNEVTIWLKNHNITFKSIERWDKVYEDGTSTLAYFKVFVSQENDQVFPESYPKNDVVMTFEIHQ